VEVIEVNNQIVIQIATTIGNLGTWQRTVIKGSMMHEMESCNKGIMHQLTIKVMNSHEVLHINIKVQTNGNIDLERNEREEITREGNMEGGKPPHLVPPINKNRKWYVKKVKNSTKPSKNKDHTSKSKRIQRKQSVDQEKKMDGTWQTNGDPLPSLNISLHTH
jgi:hypothetical protein